ETTGLEVDWKIRYVLFTKLLDENVDVKVSNESVADIADIEKKDSVDKVQKLIE
ncbi:8891_t:CDS:2, partial [Gigaspora rosea]